MSKIEIMFTIKADTPADMRDAIVNYMCKEALLYEGKKTTTNRTRMKTFYQDRADCLRVMANFIMSCEIEPVTTRKGVATGLVEK